MTITPPKTKKRKASLDPVRHYAEEVLGSGIVAGPYVRLACERHLEDLEVGLRRGLRYDNDLAQVAFEFWSQLSLPEGNPFVLLPWQQFCTGSLFGWLAPDGYRRFRTAYIETGKGNGKSPWIAGIGLYGLFVDDEQIPEIYAVATKKEQARICFNDALNICARSEVLIGRYEGLTNSIYCPENGGSFKPISADKKQSGPRPHIALVDERHEHETDTIVSMLRAGFKGRNQPLIVMITNTPQKETTVCGKDRDYSIKILNKVYENDQWFGYVCSLDKEDDWKDESVWEKANPSLGTVITKKYLRERVNEAEGILDKEAETKRLNFCIMTGSAKRAISVIQWDKNNPTVHVPLEQQAAAYRLFAEKLRGRKCYGGLDVGLVSDLTAYVLFFPPTESDLCAYFLSWYWCPEADIEQRSRAGVPYAVWNSLGFLKATEGETTDLAFVLNDIIALHSYYQIVRTAYDRTFAKSLIDPLMQEGCEVLEYGQGDLSMNPPMCEILRWIKSAQIRHGSHPITRWCAENLVCRKGPTGLIKPDKERSPEKIDGISAMAMSVGGWLHNKDDGTSVYEQKGQLLA